MIQAFRTAEWRSVGLGLALGWILLGSGCADDCDSYDYTESGPVCKEDACVAPPDNCSPETPATARLSIHLSKPLPRVVKIYRGAAYETGDLVVARTPSVQELLVELPLGSYSVTALYITGTDSILAVDGAELSYHTLDTCSKTCLVGDGGDVDLSVKN